MRILFLFIFSLFLIGCSKNRYEKKGFQVRELIEDEEGNKTLGLPIDSLQLESRPRNVLLTGNQNHRLIPIYKINYDKKTFSGSNDFHYNWQEYSKGNNWNHHFMPGFEVVYGYNFINVSHFNHHTQERKSFFKQPVLIKNLYYPAPSSDTLNFQKVNRDYYMVSVYDEDTNKDGFINVKDLRRFYYFDIHATQQKILIPEEYSVMNSEYDPANDYMYIFARLDENKNGQMEQEESIDVFWIDLNNPSNLGKMYSNDTK